MYSLRTSYLPSQILDGKKMQKLLASKISGKNNAVVENVSQELMKDWIVKRF